MIEKLGFWEEDQIDPNHLLSHVHGVQDADVGSAARWLRLLDQQQNERKRESQRAISIA